MSNEFVNYEGLSTFLKNLKEKIIAPMKSSEDSLAKRVSALEQRGSQGGEPIFKARNKKTQAPKVGEKYWTSKSYGESYGGVNIYDPIGANGYVLPNCVSYVYGRICEIYDQSKPDFVYFPGGFDGYKYYDNCISHQMPGGSIPKLGAIACWDNNTEKIGHVAIVETISQDGDIYNIDYSESWYGHPEHEYYVGSTSSESNYSFSDGTWTFRGFIYPFELRTTPSLDLAKVAYSGSYNDLINKPTIDTQMSSSSTNSVQNKIIKSYVDTGLSGKVDNTAAGGSGLINKLTAGTSAPQDDDYYVAQYAGGGTSTTTYHRRKHSSLWDYIKSKADSIYLSKAGDRMTGLLSLGGQNGGIQFNNPIISITGHGNGTAFHNMANPSDPADGANKTYVDTRTPDYSTTEVATNRKWKDGKTIYQRTISGTLAVTTSNSYYMLYNQTDVDTLINSYGRVAYVSGTGYSWYSLPLYPYASTRYFQPFVNDYNHSPSTNRGFKVGARWDSAVTLTYDITFEYTKNE